ncbi:MAG: hypothetical protein Homavirus12_15, partial [Homavirus sp.]
ELKDEIQELKDEIEILQNSNNCTTNTNNITINNYYNMYYNVGMPDFSNLKESDLTQEEIKCIEEEGVLAGCNKIFENRLLSNVMNSGQSFNPVHMTCKHSIEKNNKLICQVSDSDDECIDFSNYGLDILNNIGNTLKNIQD